MSALLAMVVGLQIALAPLATAVANAGPRLDPFDVICSHDGGLQRTSDRQDSHDVDHNGCCEAGCLMAVAGFLPPPSSFLRIEPEIYRDAGDAQDPPLVRQARPRSGLPHTPRAPPPSIG